MKKLIIALTVLSFLTMQGADARTVTGKVHSGKKNLSGVIVTDGASFTKTSGNGTFKLEIDDAAKFVWVVTPSGYTADYSSGTPEFYRVATAETTSYDFDLIATRKGADFTLFSISDPQIKTQEQFDEFIGKPLEAIIDEAAKYKDNVPTVGVFLGDNVWDSYDLFGPYKENLKRAGIPFYAVIGNHDYNKSEKGWECARKFEAAFGPTYYAFQLGKDYVIVLNNIMYRGNKKYTEGYYPEVQNFLKGLLEFIPKGTHLFIAQHSPVKEWWNGRTIVDGDKVLAMLDGYKVDFISGHTHIQNNIDYTPDIHERNAASICGSWWTSKICNDGTPRGFEVFTAEKGQLKNYYKPVDHPADYISEVIKPGQIQIHPNEVLVNVWDYDSRWTVEWSEDGVQKGAMKQVEGISPDYTAEILEFFEKNNAWKQEYKQPRKNIHYFACEPGQYSKQVKIKVTSPYGVVNEHTVDLTPMGYLDVQAHRGGAGLMPENTWYSMRNAIDMGVNTLEFDLQISKDKKVVVSHDAYFHSRYATRPDGSEVKKGEPLEYIYTMPYDSVLKYDVGKRPGNVWPDKAQICCVKPLAGDLIDMVEAYTQYKGLSPMRYNIEIKSRKGKGEGTDWPDYKEFCDRCLDLLLSKGLGDRLVVQCFDTRALEYMHEKYPQVKLSFLTDKEYHSWEEIKAQLTFLPEWISPNYKVVTKEMVEGAHKEGVKIVPWTCDDKEEMKAVISTGIDALITNYPDRLLEITRGYSSAVLWTHS